MTATVEVDGLSKQFVIYERNGLFKRTRTTRTAVTDISFGISAGEMVGYVGPNGAGKSTTVKMLTGILVPDSGTCVVAGLTPYKKRIELARRIGVVFGQRSNLWWDLPLIDSFELLRHLYRVDTKRHEQNLDECVERLAIAEVLTTPVRQLSLGQRMRGELTAALLHEPDVLFLDEPTIGLDIVSKAAVREFLSDLNTERSTTVLLTTHDLDDIERLCNRLLIIDHGSVIYDGGLTELRDQYEPYRTLVVDLATATEPLVVEGAETMKVDGPRQWLRFHRDRLSASQLIARVGEVAEIRDLTIEEPEIESVVAKIYTARP